ncbi:MAG: polyprenyl synthetase family protein [Lactobacillales bacterium]|jgi:heptaprenyl diphosphate synthase|nr:polyprenyl synthetase family protein [Lactobacillales bacterium]
MLTKNNTPVIGKQLDKVAQTIEEHLVVRNKDIERATTELQRAGGKMLRPSFLLIFAALGDTSKQSEEQLISLAASVEVLHMATLIHDDIVDDSPMRRGIQTVQSKYGKDIAVYTGDLLFTVYFELLASSGDLGDFIKVNSKAMKKILLGELDQMHTRFNQEITMLDYFRSISGKTAELFSLACREGAHFGYCPPNVEKLATRIGTNIGLAFQVLDDILDYSATRKDLKKPVLEDISEGVYTSPLILGMQKNREAFCPFLDKKEPLTVEESDNLRKLVIESGGLDAAKELAQRLTQKALDDIDHLPKGKAQKLLLKLTKELLKRTY